MRRKEREVTDPERIADIVETCDCCRLGLQDGTRIYIVPMNFGYTNENGQYIIYLHGATEGRKIDLIKRTGYAAFEMDCSHQGVTADTACNHSELFQSVIGEGKIELLEDMTDKKQGLAEVMRHNTGRADWEFPEAAVKATAVIRLTVTEMSCKEHQ